MLSNATLNFLSDIKIKKIKQKLKIWCQVKVRLKFRSQKMECDNFDTQYISIFSAPCAVPVFWKRYKTEALSQSSNGNDLLHITLFLPMIQTAMNVMFTSLKKGRLTTVRHCHIWRHFPYVTRLGRCKVGHRALWRQCRVVPQHVGDVSVDVIHGALT